MLHIYLYYFVGKIYQKIIQLKINLFNEVNKFDISTKAFLIHISRKMYPIFKQRAHCNQIIDCDSWRKYCQHGDI